MSRYSMSVLRAFVSVGRHTSFSGAASELGISQSAVSRHVASLELDLNCRLLDRTTRRVSLTAEGESLLRELIGGLSQIDRAVDAVRRRTINDVLNVSVSPFLSAVWFTPRLLEFLNDNPDLNIRLTHSYEPPRFEEGRIDVGINWSHEPRRHRTTAERLVSGALIPVCSPSFAHTHLPTREIAQLLKCNLYHEFDIDDWQGWFENANLRPDSIKSQQISDAGALRRAALSGKGVSLLFEALIQDDISDGRLVAPFDITVHTGKDYWLTYPVEHSSRPALKHFVRWLRKQAVETTASVDRKCASQTPDQPHRCPE